MSGLVLRRLLQGLPILIGIALIALALTHLAPGGPEGAASTKGVICHLVTA